LPGVTLNYGARRAISSRLPVEEDDLIELLPQLIDIL
jgi:hypothetical protein